MKNLLIDDDLTLEQVLGENPLSVINDGDNKKDGNDKNKKPSGLLGFKSNLIPDDIDLNGDNPEDGDNLEDSNGSEDNDGNNENDTNIDNNIDEDGLDEVANLKKQISELTNQMRSLISQENLDINVDDSNVNTLGLLTNVNNNFNANGNANINPNTNVNANVNANTNTAWNPVKFVDDSTFTDAFQSASSLNAMLNKGLQQVVGQIENIINQKNQGVISNITPVVHNTAVQAVMHAMTSREFFEQNPDLSPYANYVGKVVNLVGSQNPNASLKNIFSKAENIVRNK